MRYVAAYLLAVLGGKENPSASDIKKILDSVGVEVNNDNLDIVMKNLKGKNLEELIDEGSIYQFLQCNAYKILKHVHNNAQTQLAFFK